MLSGITSVKADNIGATPGRRVSPSVVRAGMNGPGGSCDTAGRGHRGSGHRGGAGRGSAASRRDRLRAATIDEIIQTARQLLVKDGPEAVSLRAIAREMGMTAPGLYRYFGSHEELVRHLCADIFTELGADIHRAIEAATPPAGGPTIRRRS